MNVRMVDSTGTLVAVDGLDAVPRAGDFVDTVDGSLFRVFRVTWRLPSPDAYASARLDVEKVCARCHRHHGGAGAECPACAGGE